MGLGDREGGMISEGEKEVLILPFLFSTLYMGTGLPGMVGYWGRA